MFVYFQGIFTTLILAWAYGATAAPRQPFCQRDEACWPTAVEIDELRAELEPTANRSLVYFGAGHSLPSLIPLDSPDNQPLYGQGVDMSPVYVEEAKDAGRACFANGTFGQGPSSCIFATRNNPLYNWTAAFVAWPLTKEHVVATVRFAAKHRLCLSVAGTGHDFLARHSCRDGLMLRTTLLKTREWANAEATQVTLGAGVTFSEAQEFVSSRNRFISSGWAASVGIAGWSLGGGHGFAAPQYGLGVDNVVAAELVLANGTVVNVSSSEHADVWFALRGGGGSTWGVVTLLTLRAHATPTGGFAMRNMFWGGLMCGEGETRLNSLIEGYLKWAEERSARWAGLAIFTPVATPNDPLCNATWVVFVQYVFHGSSDDEEYRSGWDVLEHLVPLGVPSKQLQYATWWEEVRDADLLPVAPVETQPNGLPSVLLSRTVVQDGLLATTMQERMSVCRATGVCWTHQLYHCLTGNHGSPHAENVAIPEAFRSALMHLVIHTDDAETFASVYYPLGDHSYFGESAVKMHDWPQRLWGEHYARLCDIKQRIDPTGVFWCRHCIGDVDESE